MRKYNWELILAFSNTYLVIILVIIVNKNVPESNFSQEGLFTTTKYFFFREKYYPRCAGANRGLKVVVHILDKLGWGRKRGAHMYV